MPRMQYTDLPAAKTAPIQDNLRAQWRIEAEALGKQQFSDRGAFEAAKGKLDAKYKMKEHDAVQVLRQQLQADQKKQDLISGYKKEYEEGGMTPERRAVVESKYPEEVETAIFGKEQEFILPSYLRSTGFRKNMEAYAKQAPTIGEFWTREGREPKTKKGLIAQYERWKESELYDTPDMTIDERGQLDREWDTLMASSKMYNKWWSDKATRKPIIEVKALRGTGKISDATKNMAAGVTPLGITLGKQMRKRHYPARFTGGVIEKQEQKPKPIRQRNKQTGQERISYDGGQTWQMNG